MTRDEAMELIQDGCVGVKEAAQFLGLSRAMLYVEMGAGRLRYLKIGARRLIPKRELKRYLAERVLAGGRAA